ncbi:MAG: ATPase, partial [bacterium]|nr:ATPase [bacterium]
MQIERTEVIMATAEQVKSLIRSHFADEGERFTTFALQLAAHEAKRGHKTLAHEIRALVDKAKSASVRFTRFNRELADLVISGDPKERLADLIVSDEMRNRIMRILREYRQQDKLKKHGLGNRRKMLFAGP